MSHSTPRRSLRSAAFAAFALALGVLSFSASPVEAALRQVTVVSVSCTPNTVQAGQSTTCKVFVNGNATARPKGVVSFTSSRGSGFTSANCFLGLNTAPSAPVNQSTCSVQYAPPGVGNPTRKDIITAKYLLQRPPYAAGNPFRPGSGQTTVSVPAAATQPEKVTPIIELDCDDPIVAGSPGTCVVYLTDPTSFDIFDVPHSGTVTFKSSRPKGMNAGNSSCTSVATLPMGFGQAYGTCSITYIPPDAGYPTRVDTITATYGGDAKYGKATTSASFSVPKAGGPA